MSSNADEEVFDELHAWLLADSIRRVEAKGDSAVAAQPLESATLQARGPDNEALHLATRFAEAQQAGEFYVRYITAVQQASRRVARAAGKNVAADSGLADAERAAAVEQFGQLAVVSFLQRFEPLTREEIVRLIEAYESRSGAWYVLAYTEAIAATLEKAAERAAAAIQ